MTIAEGLVQGSETSEKTKELVHIINEMRDEPYRIQKETLERLSDFFKNSDFAQEAVAVNAVVELIQNDDALNAVISNGKTGAEFLNSVVLSAYNNKISKNNDNADMLYNLSLNILHINTKKNRDFADVQEISLGLLNCIPTYNEKQHGTLGSMARKSDVSEDVNNRALEEAAKWAGDDADRMKENLETYKEITDWCSYPADLKVKAFVELALPLLKKEKEEKKDDITWPVSRLTTVFGDEGNGYFAMNTALEFGFKVFNKKEEREKIVDGLIAVARTRNANNIKARNYIVKAAAVDPELVKDRIKNYLNVGVRIVPRCTVKIAGERKEEAYAFLIENKKDVTNGFERAILSGLFNKRAKGILAAYGKGLALRANETLESANRLTESAQQKSGCGKVFL